MAQDQKIKNTRPTQIDERDMTTGEIDQLFGNLEQTMTLSGQNRTALGRGVNKTQRVTQAAKQAYQTASGKPTNPATSGTAASVNSIQEHFDRVAAVIPVVAIPRRNMIDRSATIMNWSLNESLGENSNSVELTQAGIDTVFENLALWRVVVLESDAASAQILRERWNRADEADYLPAPRGTNVPAVRSNLPVPRGASVPAVPANSNSPGEKDMGWAEVVPKDQPAAGAAPASSAASARPGFFSRAWQGTKNLAGQAARAAAPAAKSLGRGAAAAGKAIGRAAIKTGKVAGSSLAAAGRELTTKFTANRLRSGWKSAGSPTDSDQLYQWLVQNQKVPAEVVGDVYGKMNIPIAATRTAPGAAASDTTATNQVRPAKDYYSGRRTPDGGMTYMTPDGKTRKMSKAEFDRLTKKKQKAGGVMPGTVQSATAQAAGGSRSERAAAREIDAEIDDLVRALRKVDSVTAPAYVKYIRDRLDQTFGPVAAPTAPAAGTFVGTGKGPFANTKQRRTRKAQATTEGLTWSRKFDPSHSLLQ